MCKINMCLNNIALEQNWKDAMEVEMIFFIIFKKGNDYFQRKNE